MSRNTLITADREIIQKYIRSGGGLEISNELSLTLDKCKLSGLNPGKVTMHSSCIQHVRGIDLGITIKSDMKPTMKCKAAYKKTNTMLGFIAEKFVCKTPEVTLPLCYNSSVRPRLE